MKKCVICGSEEDVVIHHIDENKKNNDISNLIPICRRLHGLIHSKKHSEIFLPLIPKGMISTHKKIHDFWDAECEPPFLTDSQTKEMMKDIESLEFENFMKETTVFNKDDLIGFFKVTAYQREKECTV